MKKGSGDDPFDDEERTSEEPSAGTGDIVEENEGMEPDTPDSDTATAATTEPPTSTENQPTSTTAAQSTDNLPYLARRQLRNRSVKADRDQIPFFLRDPVQQGERDLRRSIEDLLNQEVNKTDLREAAYVFAQRHPEGVAEILREWGIEYLE